MVQDVVCVQGEGKIILLCNQREDNALGTSTCCVMGQKPGSWDCSEYKDKIDEQLDATVTHPRDVEILRHLVGVNNAELVGGGKD